MSTRWKIDLELLKGLKKGDIIRYNEEMAALYQDTYGIILDAGVFERHGEFKLLVYALVDNSIDSEYICNVTKPYFSIVSKK